MRKMVIAVTMLALVLVPTMVFAQEPDPDPNTKEVTVKVTIGDKGLFTLIGSGVVDLTVEGPKMWYCKTLGFNVTANYPVTFTVESAENWGENSDVELRMLPALTPGATSPSRELMTAEEDWSSFSANTPFSLLNMNGPKEITTFDNTTGLPITPTQVRSSIMAGCDKDQLPDAGLMSDVLLTITMAGVNGDDD